jgi:hypothetical protein
LRFNVNVSHLGGKLDYRDFWTRLEKNLSSFTGTFSYKMGIRLSSFPLSYPVFPSLIQFTRFFPFFIQFLAYPVSPLIQFALALIQFALALIQLPYGAYPVYLSAYPVTLWRLSSLPWRLSSLPWRLSSLTCLRKFTFIFPFFIGENFTWFSPTFQNLKPLFLSRIYTTVPPSPATSPAKLLL